MEFKSSRQQEIELEFDPISESEIDDLVGSAVSDLQDLLYGTSISAKQILKIMHRKFSKLSIKTQILPGY